jgi:hypothetical protein
MGANLEFSFLGTFVTQPLLLVVYARRRNLSLSIIKLGRHSRRGEIGIKNLGKHAQKKRKLGPEEAEVIVEVRGPCLAHELKLTKPV